MTQVAYKLTEPVLAEAPQCETLTLLDLVAAIADEAETEEEVIATIQHMLETGKVRLVGNFRSLDVDTRFRNN